MSTSPTNAQLHVADKKGQFVFVHPETNTSQVIDKETGKSLEEILALVKQPGFKIVPFSLVATADNQKVFTFTDADYNVTNDVPTVYMNGEFMHPTEEYSITKSGDKVTLSFVTGVKTNDKVYINVHRSLGLVGIQPISAFSVYASTADQKVFTVTDPDFKVESDLVMLYVNGEFMHPIDEYTVVKEANNVKITLAQGIAVNDKVYINIHHNLSK